MTGLITGVDQFTSDRSRKTDLERDGENGYPPFRAIHIDFRSLLPSTLRSFIRDHTKRKHGKKATKKQRKANA